MRPSSALGMSPNTMDRVVKRPPSKRRWLLVGVASVLVLGTPLLLSRLKTAAPSVDRSTVWVDTVRKGDMVRDVQGQGTLVPEHIQWVSAVKSARVEKLWVKPGSAVKADTVLLELENPDVRLQALEAERQLASATAELVILQATLRTQRLAQESVVASLRSELNEAGARASADQALEKKGFLSTLEAHQSRTRASDLASRVDFEKRRLAALGEGFAANVAAQRVQVERLRTISEFRRQECEGLTVRAGSAGVLQEMPLQLGQWVAPGALLAKVVNPERLKAELRIAETRVKDVQLKQRARIDTRNGIIEGSVSRIDPSASAGTVRVEVELEGELPRGARPDLNVEGTIELEHLQDVLFVGRPAFANSEGTLGMLKLTADGHAERVKVELGRSSAKTVEVKSGLQEGEQVILSDLSQWDSFERIKLR